jgi:DNA modification methylase
MSRRRGAGVRAFQKEHVRAREELERSWLDRIEPDGSLEALVTGSQSQEEPLHRWVPLRQQFAPALVRRFLDAATPADPVLDPFSGSGTVAIECARLGRRAIGVEAIHVLAWLTVARLRDVDRTVLADVLAAALDATGDGRRRATSADTPRGEDVARMVCEDRCCPLPGTSAVVVGDARRLPLEDRSVGGVLTSPPYLSRYDYRRITRTLDLAWRRSADPQRPAQIAATLRSGRPFRRRGSADDWDRVPPAAQEAHAAVRNLGRGADAEVIRAYFLDLMQVLSELGRVTRPGAPVWIVIGAADFEREYVPSDLITAEMAAAAGFEVAAVVEARRLRGSGRRLGGLKGVAPRESIVQLRRGTS